MPFRKTIQMDIIHHALCEMGGHPSAAAVYRSIHADHPTISRSTVYRVLARMAEDGEILRLELGGCDSRYDGEIHPHSHVRCRLCDTVQDIPLAQVEQPADSHGFLLEDCAVIYRGLCPACREKTGL